MSSQTAIDKILDRKIEEGSHLYYLVRWKQGLEKEETWVRADSLKGAQWQVHQFNKKHSQCHQGGADSKRIKTVTTLEKNSIDEVEHQRFALNEEKQDERGETLTSTAIRSYGEPEPIVQNTSISVESQRHNRYSASFHELYSEKLAAASSLTDRRGPPKKHIESEPSRQLERSVEFILQSDGLQRQADPVRVSERPSTRMKITSVLSITIGQKSTYDRQSRTTTTLLRKGNARGPLEPKEQDDGCFSSQALSSFEQSQIRLLNEAIWKVVRMREEAYSNPQPFVIHRGTRDLMDFKFEIKSKPRHRRYKSLKDHQQNMKVGQAQSVIPPRRQQTAGEKAEGQQQSCQNISANGEPLVNQRLTTPLQYGRQLMFTPFDNGKKSTTESLFQGEEHGRKAIAQIATEPTLADGQIEAAVERDLKEQFELQSVELPDEGPSFGQQVGSRYCGETERPQQHSRTDGTWMSEIKELRAYKSKKVVRVLAATGQEHIIEYDLAKRLAPDLLLEFLSKRNVHPQSRPGSRK